MKNKICIILCILVCACASSCGPMEQVFSSIVPKNPFVESQVAKETPQAQYSQAPTLTQTPEIAQPTAPAQIEATQPPAPAESAQFPAITPSPAPSPTDAPRMYSSWANLVSFDDETGVAQFDYYNVLTGEDAVEYLVEYEGYSLDDARAWVADFADSEYIEKNHNSQLRAIDLDLVPLELMWQPNGEHVYDVIPVPSSASDFRKLYKLNPVLLLDSYPFYIEVNSGGEVSLVSQVYWP